MPTRYAGNATEQNALNAYIALLRCAETVTADTTRHLAGYKLSVGQFGVLEALLHLGPLCQRDIGRKLLRSGGNVTTVVDNLEKRGLVVRKRSLEDRRFYQVELTDAGRELITIIMPLQVEGIRERLSVLSTEEQSMLRSLCRKLGVGE